MIKEVSAHMKVVLSQRIEAEPFMPEDRETLRDLAYQLDAPDLRPGEAEWLMHDLDRLMEVCRDRVRLHVATAQRRKGGAARARKIRERGMDPWRLRFFDKAYVILERERGAAPGRDSLARKALQEYVATIPNEDLDNPDVLARKERLNDYQAGKYLKLRRKKEIPLMC